MTGSWPDRTTFLNCDPAEAVRIALAAAGGKNLGVFSPNIGALLLELELIDEIDIHNRNRSCSATPFGCTTNPGNEPIRLHLLDDRDPTSAVRVRYRPTTTAKDGLEAH